MKSRSRSAVSVWRAAGPVVLKGSVTLGLFNNASLCWLFCCVNFIWWCQWYSPYSALFSRVKVYQEVSKSFNNKLCELLCVNTLCEAHGCSWIRRNMYCIVLSQAEILRLLSQFWLCLWHSDSNKNNVSVLVRQEYLFFLSLKIKLLKLYWDACSSSGLCSTVWKLTLCYMRRLIKLRHKCKVTVSVQKCAILKQCIIIISNSLPTVQLFALVHGTAVYELL